MEPGVKVLVVLQWLLWLLLRPFVAWRERRSPRRIPYSHDPLLQVSAAALAARIRTQQVTSEDAVKAYIKRIKEVNPILNAVVEDRFEAAIKEAVDVDKLVASGTKTSQEFEEQCPLLGVPITVKESCGLAGMTQCVGSVSRIGVRAPETGDAVSRLLRAGAIPVAVTTTPEYCFSWDTNNLVTGRTVNAYNAHKTSGGSSGGEGALLGAGASVAGVGSDIAGSIRVPAHFNGVFGHKPSGRVVSVRGHFPQTTDEQFADYLVIGPMTRYAEDLRLMLRIMSGENSSILNLDHKVDLSKINVFHMEQAENCLIKISVQEDIKKCIRKSALHLRDKCGSTIKDEKFPELENSIELGVSMFFSELQDIPNILKDPVYPKENANLWLEFLKGFVGVSQFSLNTLLFYFLKEINVLVPRSKNAAKKVEFSNLTKKLEAALGENGVFLYPTFPCTAFDVPGMFYKIGGVHYTMVFNLMGFPSTHVPLGLGEDNLPVGLQVIAARNQDRLCLAVAEELERAFGGWTPPPTSSRLINK